VTAAENLNGALDFAFAADQRINAAVTRLLVEVDAIGIEGAVLLLRLAVFLGFLASRASASSSVPRGIRRESERPGRLAMPWLI